MYSTPWVRFPVAMHAMYMRARRLRLRGRSYNEIARTCDVSKSSLSLWFRHLALPKSSRVRLQSRMREGAMRGLLTSSRQQTTLARQRHRQWLNTAVDEVGKLTNRDLWMIGIGLYWGEGTKRGPGHSVRFANADPSVIWFMMRFFGISVRFRRKNFVSPFTRMRG